MDLFSTDFTLGILGGGQLGKMLLAETRKFDIRTHVLDPSSDAPSAIACNKFAVGDLMDYQTVLEFGRGVDVLTIEIEHVNVDALEALEREGKKVYPSSLTLRTIQNKARQKEFYQDNSIPCPPARIFASLKELMVDFLDGSLELPFVWKSTQFGYDGNGVRVIREAADLQGLPDVECIAEEMVDFAMELAVIVARNPAGDSVTYPVVEMEFHPTANQVEYVICPARIDAHVAAKARALALEVSQKFAHIGLLAVEMFLTHDGHILVNEAAPRPHNSGHYTIEASYTSQFENHLRAILNLPLGATESKAAAVMVNLVGAEGFSGNVIYENIEKILALDGVTPHIYGKRQTRPFRKMGHVTIVRPELSSARETAQTVRQTIRVIA